jgi:hypothetical protein
VVNAVEHEAHEVASAVQHEVRVMEHEAREMASAVEHEVRAYVEVLTEAMTNENRAVD